MKKFILFVIPTIFSLLLSSCATGPVIQSGPYAPYPVVPLPARRDMVHIVAPGETLWRIGKMYNVSPKQIMQANGLKDAGYLQKGQRLFIPNAASAVPVVTLYPSKKWKYIIIHHSATDEGSALYFDKSHNSRGWDGIGYHFVIDNGTKAKEDGQIEVSPRWLKQHDGAHCQASGMNNKSIGICLVGNFNEDLVSVKQMEALVYLVNRIRKYYRIPLNNVIGHSWVPGARTECPGKRFPWHELRESLR